MYSSFLSPHSYKANSFNYTSSYLPQTYETYQSRNNQYYSTKIMDDHRFQRTKLQRPGFLIKQSSIYPQQNDNNKIGSILQYSDLLVKSPKHRFYSEQTQQQRINTQGKNPFKQNSSLIESKMNYLTKSSRSRVGTNPNLGVRSYEVLGSDQTQQLGKSSRGYKGFQSQRIQANQEKYKQGIDDFIAKSILQNSIKKSNIQTKQYQQIKEQNSSDEDMFYKPEDGNKGKISIVKKTVSTLVKYKQNPDQIKYKGKKFVKLF